MKKKSQQRNKIRRQRPSESQDSVYTVSRFNPTQIYRFRRSASAIIGFNSYTGFTSTNGAITYGQGVAFGFSLLQTYMYGSSGQIMTMSLPSVAEFVALFDRFRIDKVSVRIIPSINVQSAFASAIGTAPTTGLPVIQTAVDYDDANAPTAVGDLLQRTDVRLLRMDREQIFEVAPRVSIGALDSNAVVSGSAQARAPWLDTSDGQNTMHYGRKFWSEALTAAPGVQQGTIVLYVDYDLSFQVPR